METLLLFFSLNKASILRKILCILPHVPPNSAKEYIGPKMNGFRWDLWRWPLWESAEAKKIMMVLWLSFKSDTFNVKDRKNRHVRRPEWRHVDSNAPGRITQSGIMPLCELYFNTALRFCGIELSYVAKSLSPSSPAISTWVRMVLNTTGRNLHTRNSHLLQGCKSVSRKYESDAGAEN